MLMIENYRTGSPWRLMCGRSYVQKGLQQAGFGGEGLAEDATVLPSERR